MTLHACIQAYCMFETFSEFSQVWLLWKVRVRKPKTKIASVRYPIRIQHGASLTALSVV